MSQEAKIVTEAGVRLRLTANHDSPSGHARGGDKGDRASENGDSGGAFFNPRMRCNRAFVLSALAALVETRDAASGPLNCLDGFAASGAMALQWKTRLGCRVRVLAVDRCPAALSALEANCQLNGVGYRRVRPHEVAEQFDADCGARHSQILTALEQVNSVTETCAFDFVHLDPFGSPAGNIESALRHLRNGGLLSVTCTDLASLLGQHPQVAMRNYGARLMRTRCAPELGARALLAFVAGCAARCGKAIHPVCCLSAPRFLFACARVERGAKLADSCLSRCVGRLALCRVCQQQRPVTGSGVYGSVGCGCSGRNDNGGEGGGAETVLGPVWLGDLFDADFVQRMAQHLSGGGSDEGDEAAKSGGLISGEDRILLRMLLDEAHCRLPPGEAASPLGSQPQFYISPKWLRLSGVDLPRLDHLIALLKRSGYAASRTHFDLTAVRTNAGVQACRELILQHTTAAAAAASSIDSSVSA